VKKIPAIEGTIQGVADRKEISVNDRQEKSYHTLKPPVKNISSFPRIRIPLPKDHRFFPDCQRETYARFIEWAMRAGSPHDWFVSMTFKKYSPDWKAFIILKKWLGHLRQGCEDKGGSRLRWISATEWQIRNVIHFHLLVIGHSLDLLSRKRWECRWQSIDRNAGICRIYNADRKAAPYLAKYIQKGDELSLGGYWRGLNSPGALRCHGDTRDSFGSPDFIELLSVSHQGGDTNEAVSFRPSP
jgi:hypothetical protein